MLSNKCLRLASVLKLHSKKPLINIESSHITLRRPTSATWRTLALTNVSFNKDEFEIFGDLKHRIPKLLGKNTKDDMENQNAFKLFNLKPKYNISMAKLQSEMRNLQRFLHPDNFANESIKIQYLSNDLSAKVNDYYRTLKDPYERAKYLLALMVNKSYDDMEESLEKLEMGSDFLTNMMEIRGKIADPNTERYELEKLNSILESELERLVIEIDKLFEVKDTKGVIERLGKLKFLSNCQNAAEDRLGRSTHY